MVPSLHSSETATNRGQDYDLEAFDKTEAPPTENGDNVNEKAFSPWEVTLEEVEDPQNMSTWYKWAIVLIVSSGAMCVTCASSMVRVQRCIPSLGANVFGPFSLLSLKQGL